MAINRPAHDYLKQFIADESDRLLKALRSYVVRMGVASIDQAPTAAEELLNEVVIEALEHAGRFDTSRQPMAWLLGIAANLIKRKRSELKKLDHREPLIRDLYEEQQALSDDELFDAIAGMAMDVDNIEMEAEISALLDGLAPADRRIIWLAILNGMDGDAIAHELNISPGAARVRLHRALQWLRLNQVFVERADHDQ